MHGRAVTHSPKSDWAQIVYGAALATRPSKPLDAPLRVFLDFIFPRPQAAKKLAWKATRPDSDNVAKAVMDALGQAQWWVDDARICDLRVTKRYPQDGEFPGVMIRVELLVETET